jgi:signal transduction histidine kinase
VNRGPRSLATGIAIGHGLLVLASIIVVSVTVYVGTIGVVTRSIDDLLVSLSQRLAETYRNRPLDALLREIDLQLQDGADSDSEVLLILGPSGDRLAGNLPGAPRFDPARHVLQTTGIERGGTLVPVRFILQDGPSGTLILVGRDLRELQEVRDLVWRALGWSALLAVLLSIAGSLALRRYLESRVATIRRAARTIEAGDLSGRVPATGHDEFGRLGQHINHMLDRIEQLMEGVRQVCNSIAHDLRTPLARIRRGLEAAQREDQPLPALRTQVAAATQDIDDLIALFDKLLQIASVESGLRSRDFGAVDANRIARDMVELYDAAAEAAGITLRLTGTTPVPDLQADRDLLANAIANLLDNAVKYAGRDATVEVTVVADEAELAFIVRDNGPGVPPADLGHVTERFYRVDRSRHLPGNGLGLATVAAIAAFHGGRLVLESGQGLTAKLMLPLRRR